MRNKDRVGPNPAPAIHTQTGEVIKVHKSQIISESREAPFYIMQWIKIGSSPVLCFYDRGANLNLIDGELAEKEELQVVTSKPSTLTVPGGREVGTEYGTYRTVLGPTEGGEYLEITCQGITRVTGGFSEYPLEEINKEITAIGAMGGNTRLPEYIGGDRVGLLIGLKSIKTDPVLIFCLPS